MFLEILLEGSSDEPTIRTILRRKFGLKENQDFRLHPHQGRGKIPRHPNNCPDISHRGLLDQLPAKLRLNHHYCSDSYYCCPKSSMFDEDEIKGECNCGADIHNDLLDRIIKFIERFKIDDLKSLCYSCYHRVYGCTKNMRVIVLIT